jgi:hypothetical protein
MLLQEMVALQETLEAPLAAITALEEVALVQETRLLHQEGLEKQEQIIVMHLSVPIPLIMV